MPGHTGGKSFSQWLHENALSIDTTELESTDDLNRPGQAVKEAYSLAARAFGAGETFFITTGSTTAIYAALLSVAAPKDEIIVFRNVHKSVLNACVMFHLTPVFTTESTIEDTLLRHPEAVAVVVTRPDYYGRCIDIKDLSEKIHLQGSKRVLIADEAHGTHYAFCPACMPVPGVTNGADIVIQSAHKTAPALTQGSYLHLSREAVGSSRVRTSRMKEALAMISTSSPSFLIAATLDFGRAFLEEYGESVSRRLLSDLEHFYSLLDARWAPCLERPTEQSGKTVYDPFRIVFTMRDMPFSTRELSDELCRHGLFIEFFDLRRMVLLCKFENTKMDFTALAYVMNEFLHRKIAAVQEMDADEKKDFYGAISRLEELDRQFREIMNTVPQRILLPHCGRTHMDHAERVPLRHAANRVVFSAIVPYPPGVPMLWPGEVLDEETILVIEKLIQYGCTIYGVEESANADTGCVTPVVCCINDDFCRKL